MVEKNKEYILDIISQGYEGEGFSCHTWTPQIRAFYKGDTTK